MPLPEAPAVRLSSADDAAPELLQGSFLRLERLRLVLGGDVRSDPFEYDIVTRQALDSVVMVPHFENAGATHVILVTALRPALYVRGASSLREVPLGPPAGLPEYVLWELPAGLVEPGETARAAAARELFEEVGARVEESALEALGPSMLPAPGMVAEVQSFFHVRVDPKALAAPPGDSSALERASIRGSLPLGEALALCSSGVIRDGKTELGLRRLREVLGAP